MASVSRLPVVNELWTSPSSWVSLFFSLYEWPLLLLRRYNFQGFPRESRCNKWCCQWGRRAIKFHFPVTKNWGLKQSKKVAGGKAHHHRLLFVPLGTLCKLLFDYINLFFHIFFSTSRNRPSFDDMLHWRRVRQLVYNNISSPLFCYDTDEIILNDQDGEDSFCRWWTTVQLVGVASQADPTETWTYLFLFLFPFPKIWITTGPIYIDSWPSARGGVWPWPLITRDESTPIMANGNSFTFSTHCGWRKGEKGRRRRRKMKERVRLYVCAPGDIEQRRISWVVKSEIVEADSRWSWPYGNNGRDPAVATARSEI